MVSSGVVALFVAVAVQAVQANYIPNACGYVPPAPVCGCAVPQPQFEEGCCPGPVIEKKYVTQKAVTVPYTYSVPTYSKKCFQQPAGVDKKVIPSAFETAPVCETQNTIVKVPTTDVEIKQQPLCKRTCTTSEYTIQIPIVETTCTCSPLCKKTVKTQSNLLTTCAQKTNCAKQVCTQNKIVETPITQTVCQDYQGCINKVGAKTVLKPEIRKSCVQLPPYKCLKPVSSYGPAAYSGSYPATYPESYYGSYPATYPESYSGSYPATYPESYSGSYPATYPASYSGVSSYPGVSYYPGAADTYAAEAAYATKYDAAAAYPGSTSYYPGSASVCPCA